MYEPSPRDLLRLQGVRPEMVAVVRKCFAICPMHIFVIAGLRTLAEEHAAVATGKSQTMHSRHLGGFAVDLGIMLGNVLTWEPAYYTQLNQFMQAAATALDTLVTWGGSWKTLKDLDHWELDRVKYPDT